MNREQAQAHAAFLAKHDHAQFKSWSRPGEIIILRPQEATGGLPDEWTIHAEGELDQPRMTYKCLPTNRDRWVVYTRHRDGEMDIWLEPGEVAYAG